MRYSETLFLTDWFKARYMMSQIFLIEVYRELSTILLFLGTEFTRKRRTFQNTSFNTEWANQTFVKAFVRCRDFAKHHQNL